MKFRLTNVGETDFAFIRGGRQRRATRDTQFAFSAEFLGGHMLPDVGDPHHNGGFRISITLKPGESHEASVDLSKWFTFKEAGTYLLRGSYYMEFVDPASKKLNIIWEDFACAEFIIEIKS